MTIDGLPVFVVLMCDYFIRSPLGILPRLEHCLCLDVNKVMHYVSEAVVSDHSFFFCPRSVEVEVADQDRALRSG